MVNGGRSWERKTELFNGASNRALRDRACTENPSLVDATANNKGASMKHIDVSGCISLAS